ncbi:MAG: hypothetical protein IPM92_03565 [Saprospiraceae bacterium]|nr:hypothetical protein [Saprospiraceae bacterium]
MLGIQHKERSLEQPEGKDINDVPRPTDQFMALSIFFQDYLPQNKNFKMHIQINVASGLPYGLKGANTVYRNDQSLKAYHRVDIGFSMQLWDRSKRMQKPNSFFRFCKQAWISAEVFNLLKVKNEASIKFPIISAAKG